MSRLPVVSGKQACKILEKIGYHTDHQTGSHIILRNEYPPHRRLTIPNHKEKQKAHGVPLYARPALQSKNS